MYFEEVGLSTTTPCIYFMFRDKNTEMRLQSFCSGFLSGGTVREHLSILRCIDSPKQAKNSQFTRGNAQLKVSCNTATYSWMENSLHFRKGN